MSYLVDGNNLAHVLGLSSAGLADREACSRIVAGFCLSHGAKATIVFDGPAPRGVSQIAKTPRVSVLFSESRSADEVILRRIRDSKAPKDFTVVTSDKSLGDKAKHRGATVERSHEFARRLRPTAEPANGPGDKPGNRETAAQIEAWLAVFDPGRRRSGPAVH